MKKFTEEINSKTIEGYAEKIGRTLWVHLDGETFSYEVESSRNKKSKSNLSGGSVLAPMPGKITKVLVSNGDRVEADTAVIVMEAMKMEYTLKAPIAGSVSGLKRDIGDLVKNSEVVLEVKEEG